MNKILRKPQLTPYEADYAQWCAEQGALLREGRLSDLDRENLAEEIESLGRSEKGEIEQRLNVLLLHLLENGVFRQGTQRSAKLARKQLSNSGLVWRKQVKRENASLKNYPAEFLDGGLTCLPRLPGG